MTAPITPSGGGGEHTGRDGFFPSERVAIEIVHKARKIYQDHSGDGAWVAMELAYVQLITVVFDSHATLKARIEELTGYLNDILTAEQEFRDQLPQEWEGDPLHDACQIARATLASKGGVK